ncbi:MAG TPA: DUF177 domain-containing protein, partial [Prolixibacteraceae bacterium]|nr:DUF177 domain-containing protein [Prolixibacteraceae bacterium]
EEHQLNLAQLIYEYISLAIPLKRVHPEDKNGDSQCDTEMLDKINNYVQPEVDKDEEENVDPRWAALKKLKNNN